jgi:hypothetical protein
MTTLTSSSTPLYTSCPYCQGLCTSPSICPAVRIIEFDAMGRVVRVEKFDTRSLNQTSPRLAPVLWTMPWSDTLGAQAGYSSLDAASPF